MIAAYAQASDRQGLDAAIDGSSVTLDNAAFVATRDKSASLNIRRKPQHVTGVQIRSGRGIIRLELPGSEDDAESRSPIVIAIGHDELRTDTDALVVRVVETISAIDRRCDQAAIAAAIKAATETLRARRTWARIGTVVAIALTAAGIVAIAVARTSTGVSNG